MKTFPIKLQQAVSSESATICFFWRLVRTDGKVFCFTDHDQNIVINGETYLAGTGATPSSIQTVGGMGVSNLEVQALIDSEVILDAELLNGVWDCATVVCGIVDWTDPDNSVGVLRVGTLGEVAVEGKLFTAELKGLMQRLQQNTVRLISPECDVKFGSQFCGKNLAAYTTNTQITSVTSAGSIEVSGSFSANYFAYGELVVTSGNAAGQKAAIMSSTTGGGLTFLLPLKILPSIGDSVSIVAGCNKTKDMCKTKFNNLANFQGFPFVPTVDQVTKGAL